MSRRMSKSTLQECLMFVAAPRANDSCTLAYLSFCLHDAARDHTLYSVKVMELLEGAVLSFAEATHLIATELLFCAVLFCT